MIRFLIILLSISANLISVSWDMLLEQHRASLDDTTYNIINQQYLAYTHGQAPTIAQPCIKEIPIKESGQELIDLGTANHARIKIMADEELPLAHEYLEDIDPRSNNFAKMRKSVYNALTLMIPELDRLAPEFGYEPGDLEIRLFEGLRDIETQKQLFETKKAQFLQENPSISEQEAYEETSKWVSPYINNVPVHSTGAAIDIHFWSRKNNCFCDMGRFNKGGALAPTFTQDPLLTLDQANNRLLLLCAATAAGLINYVYEFWHFSVGDRYAAYWLEPNPTKRVACYHSINKIS
ncbi:MAG TPA: M15 family metallopeptidase [Candidatus Babeliaceae bacterium]|nr:M15 family metallopeptidase [Candidatus Babeliaceae bacterium]